MQERYNLRNDDVVVYFFQQMSEQPENKNRFIQDFDEFYFKVRPRLGNLRHLLFGNLDQSAYPKGTCFATKVKHELKGQPQGLFLLMADF